MGGNAGLANKKENENSGLKPKNIETTSEKSTITLAIDAFIDNKGVLTADYFKITGGENALTGSIDLEVNPNIIGNLFVTNGSVKLFRTDDSLDSDAVTGLDRLNYNNVFEFEESSAKYTFWADSSTSTLNYDADIDSLKIALNSQWRTEYLLKAPELQVMEEGILGYHLGFTEGKDVFTVKGNGQVVYGGGDKTGEKRYAGILIKSGETLNIENSTWTFFKSNNGGVIYNDGGTVNIHNVVFAANTATEKAGAIYNDGANARINFTGQVSFINNTVQTTSYIEDYGGAIYNNNGVLVFEGDALFKDNSSGNRYMRGGAIYIKGGTVEFKGKTEFYGNQARTGTGGAIYSEGATLIIGDDVIFSSNSSMAYSGALELSYDSIVTIGKNAKFTYNKTINSNATYGGGGGAFWIGAGTYFTIDDGALFDSNESAYSGGAFVNNSNAIFGSVTCTNNKAKVSGAAIFNYQNLTINGDATFTGNKKNYNFALENSSTNGTPNDIYNSGIFNFNNGNVLMDGGIEGTGTINITSSDFNLINGAIIEGNTVNVKGSTVTINSGSTNPADVVSKTAINSVSLETSISNL